MEWVLDASVTVGWCFEDERTPHLEGLLDRLRDSPAVVPQMWSLEVANVLILAVRRRKITVAERSEFLKMLNSHPIHTDLETSDIAFGSILTLADKYQLTSYDAAYLELAMRLGIPLATLDTHLRAAAKKVGVPLL